MKIPFIDEKDVFGGELTHAVVSASCCLNVQIRFDLYPFQYVSVLTLCEVMN